MDCENCRHLTVVSLHDTGPSLSSLTSQDKVLNPELLVLETGVLITGHLCGCVTVGENIFWNLCFIQRERGETGGGIGGRKGGREGERECESE